MVFSEMRGVGAAPTGVGVTWVTYGRGVALFRQAGRRRPIIIKTTIRRTLRPHSPLFEGGDQPVAYPSHRQQMFRLTGVIFNFFPQPADMNIQGPGIAHIICFPDRFHDRFTAKDLPLVLDEQVEQFEFFRGKAVMLSISQDLLLLAIHN